MRVIAAFWIFCVVASGTYLVNDVFDAESDRNHPVKWLRPVASGALRPGVALCVGNHFSLGRPLAAAISGEPWGFAVVVASYVLLSIAYSIRLKREPVIELAVVASCFVLRAVAGGVAASVPLSNWFLVFTSFAALFIVTGKRYAEHTRLGSDRGAHRLVLYSIQSVLPQVGSDDLSDHHACVVLPLSVRAERVHRLMRGSKMVWIELTVIPVVLSILHILRLLDGGHGGEPEEIGTA